MRAGKVLSLGLRVLSHWILGSPLHDINAGCRAFRRDVARRIEIKHRINFVGDEIYARCRIAGWKVAEVIVRHFPREAGAVDPPAVQDARARSCA